MRKIIETELVENHHWLPQDIEKIPYKWLQEHFTILNVKRQAVNTRQQSESFKKQQNSMVASRGSGSTKRMWKTIPLGPGATQ